MNLETLPETKRIEGGNRSFEAVVLDNIQIDGMWYCILDSTKFSNENTEGVLIGSNDTHTIEDILIEKGVILHGTGEQLAVGSIITGELYEGD